MQTVGIFSNTNTNIRKQCTAITSNTAIASSFISKISVCFYESKKPFISNFFWKMMSYWRHKPVELWRYLSKKWRNIIIIKKTVFGRNLVRKQSVQLMLWKRRRKNYAFKLLTSVPRDEIVFRKTQKLNFMRRNIQEGLQPAYFFSVIHIFRQRGRGVGMGGGEFLTSPWSE